MAKRNSWASHLIWGSVAVCAVLASAVTIALVVGAHRGMEFSAFAKRMIPAAAPEEMQARAPAPVAAPEAGASSHEIARLNDALRTLAAERDRLAERLEVVERTVGESQRPSANAPLRPARPNPKAPRSFVRFPSKQAKRARLKHHVRRSGLPPLRPSRARPRPRAIQFRRWV